MVSGGNLQTTEQNELSYEIHIALVEFCVHVVSYLVAYGLGAAPLQKDLLDAAGAGHPKTLRAL